MTCALSSLKKKNRSGCLPGHIPGHRPMPFRHPECTEEESKLLEEVTISMAVKRLSKREIHNEGTLKSDRSQNASLRSSLISDACSSPRGSQSDSGTSHPSDREMMGIFMKRLTMSEQKLQLNEEELKTKNREISILRDKLSIIGKARLACDGPSFSGGQSNTYHTGDVWDLEQRCLLLQQKVHEMERFLADYGMIWIGEKDKPDVSAYLKDSSSEAISMEVKSRQLARNNAATDPSFLSDFECLFESIRDLNVIAGEGTVHICHTEDGARLKPQQSVPVTFYSNGMIMFGGPFRPYTDPLTIQCMQDFLDGYFPSELQSRFPDGVPFSVKDMRTVTYQPYRTSDAFSGSGVVLGGEGVCSNIVSRYADKADLCMDTKRSPCEASHGLPENDQVSLQPALTFPDSSSSLPRSFVNNGKLIDLAFTDSRVSDKNRTTVVRTKVTGIGSEVFSEKKDDGKNNSMDVTTLKIKSETGDHTYIAKLFSWETFTELREYLNVHRKQPPPEYIVCNVYPRKVFSDNSATMQESGLMPNGVLCLQALKDA